jgi:hypothetical protein
MKKWQFDRLLVRNCCRPMGSQKIYEITQNNHNSIKKMLSPIKCELAKNS